MDEIDGPSLGEVFKPESTQITSWSRFPGCVCVPRAGGPLR